MANRRRLFRRNQPSHRYAASQVAIPVVEDSIKALKARTDDWQRKVFSFADLIPEVMSGYLFVHNTLDMVDLEVEKFNRESDEWERAPQPEMRGIERRLNAAFQMGRAGAIMHLVEETYLLIEKDGSTFKFETLAPTEIKGNGRKIEKRVLKDGEKMQWRTLRDGEVIVRIYTPDPANREVAGGPHKSLLGLLETMALELLRDQKDSLSVLAGNGVFYIPTEILPDEGDTLDASETPGTRAHFESRLEQAMLARIDGANSGEVIVPILLYGPGEQAANIRHIVPGRDENSTEVGERMDRYVQRYARSVDLPMEIIIGLGDSNHWTDWKVDENTWAYHLKPRAQRIADALYAAIGRSLISALELDPDEYRFGVNAAKAIAKQDMTKAATDAYRAGALTPEAYAEAIGFDTDDLRDDADVLQLAYVAGHPGEIQAIERAMQQDIDQRVSARPRSTPERTAAAKSQVVLLDQASRLANQQQTRLFKMYSRILSRVAADAARDGRKAAKLLEAERKAAGVSIADLPFTGYDPAEYFERYRAELEEGTEAELFGYLRRIATLVGLNYLDLRQIWETEFSLRAGAVVIAAEQAAQSLVQKSFQAGTPQQPNDATIRTLTSTANGGSNQSNGAAGNTERPTHAGEDPAMQAALTDSVGSFATQYTWVYGDPATRRDPFEEHKDLSGRKWFSWEEFDALDKGGGDPSTVGSVYFPGDHNGCQCNYDIEFALTSEG